MINGDRDSSINQLQSEIEHLNSQRITNEAEWKKKLDETKQLISGKEKKRIKKIKELEESLTAKETMIETLQKDMNEVSNLKTSSDEETKRILEEKDHQIAAKEAEIEAIKMINGDRVSSINQLQTEIEHLNSQRITNEAEWKQKIDESKHQSAAKEVKIKELKQSLAAKETLIETLQKD